MAFDIGALLSGIGQFAGNLGANAAISKGTGYQVQGANEAANQIGAASQRAQMQLQPYYDVGWNTLQNLFNMSGGNGEAGKATALERFRNFDPGYQFRMDQGVLARDRSAAARGALDSGGYAKELTSFGQGLADQSWKDYVGLNQSLAGMGQTAAAQAGALDASAAGNLADIYTYRGDARAAGQVAKSNNNNSLLNSAAGLFGFFL